MCMSALYDIDIRRRRQHRYYTISSYVYDMTLRDRIPYDVTYDMACLALWELRERRRARSCWPCPSTTRARDRASDCSSLLMLGPDRWSVCHTQYDICMSYTVRSLTVTQACCPPAAAGQTWIHCQSGSASKSFTEFTPSVTQDGNGVQAS